MPLPGNNSYIVGKIFSSVIPQGNVSRASASTQSDPWGANELVYYVMLNVSKRSLVDTEFSVSTFGVENSNFLPSSKVVHSSLCAAFGVSAWGSLGEKKIGAGQRDLFTTSLLSLPSCHRDGALGATSPTALCS